MSSQVYSHGYRFRYRSVWSWDSRSVTVCSSRVCVRNHTVTQVLGNPARGLAAPPGVFDPMYMYMYRYCSVCPGSPRCLTDRHLGSRLCSTIQTQPRGPSARPGTSRLLEGCTGEMNAVTGSLPTRSARRCGHSGLRPRCLRPTIRIRRSGGATSRRSPVAVRGSPSAQQHTVADFTAQAKEVGRRAEVHCRAAQGLPSTMPSTSAHYGVRLENACLQRIPVSIQFNSS